MTNQKRLLLALSLLSLGTGAVYGPRVLTALSPAVEYSAQGNPVEKAASVAEETHRADLVVRARVVSVKNRVLTEILPVYAEDAVTVIGKRPSSTPFTDVTLEVLETLKGKSEPTITTLQTGGTLKNGPLGRAQKFTIAGDPLFQEGSEHILFLVDISDDGVHSKGRQLYRVVNQLGRYEIAPDGSLIGPDRYQTDEREKLAQLPKTEQDLRQEIDLALAKGDRGNPQVR